MLTGHRRLTIIEERICDTSPDLSHAELASRKGLVVLKGIGKFWGLAGVRLGLAACPHPLEGRFRQLLGPSPVSDPAVHIGLGSLGEENWINDTRGRLRCGSARLDALRSYHGFHPEGGTDLFRLYRVPKATAVHESPVLLRTFDHSETWIQFGLPGSEEEWANLKGAIACLI